MFAHKAETALSGHGAKGKAELNICAWLFVINSEWS